MVKHAWIIINEINRSCLNRYLFVRFSQFIFRCCQGVEESSRDWSSILAVTFWTYLLRIRVVALAKHSPMRVSGVLGLHGSTVSCVSVVWLAGSMLSTLRVLLSCLSSCKNKSDREENLQAITDIFLSFSWANVCWSDWLWVEFICYTWLSLVGWAFDDAICSSFEITFESLCRTNIAYFFELTRQFMSRELLMA